LLGLPAPTGGATSTEQIMLQHPNHIQPSQFTTPVKTTTTTTTNNYQHIYLKNIVIVNNACPPLCLKNFLPVASKAL
jgi:hypothetical protein